MFRFTRRATLFNRCALSACARSSINAFDIASLPTTLIPDLWNGIVTDQAIFRADLHGTIFVACDKLATSLRQAYDITYDCRSVLKCYDIFFLTNTTIISELHATKIVQCKSALRRVLK